MEYANGYVAFIDILGFSEMVMDTENGECTLKLFSTIEKIRQLFNEHPKWKCKIAFFSDSIVLTSQMSYWYFLLPLRMLEGYLQTELGLLYRGGVVKGQYYHNDNIVFGPAIVEAYKIEMSAEESRIVVEDKNLSEGYLEFFRDYDGKWCLNPYSLRIWDELPYDINENDVEALRLLDIIAILKSSLQNIRKEILESVLYYQYSDKDIPAKIIRKYWWRMIPFNYTCDFILNYPQKIDYLKNSGYILNEEDKNLIKKMKFSFEDIVLEYGYM